MNTFGKDERLNKRKLIEKLFSSDSSSFSVFPLRVVYVDCFELDVRASILVSVSKRHFKRAVKRNRVKRQIREAYRLNKAIFRDAPSEKHWLIAFIYLSDSLFPSDKIDACLRMALNMILAQ